MMSRTAFAALIPHTGPMCLLDSLITWDSTRIHCRTATHGDTANPLAVAGRLSVVCGIEYAAQAMALHGALCGPRDQQSKSGYLASVRDVACHVAWLDDLAGQLDIHAAQLHAESIRVIYEFRVQCDGRDILSGRAAIVLDGTPQ